MTKHTIDTKELELPDTRFVRDIDNRVFQAIVFECLTKIENISLLEENFIGNLLHRNSPDRIKGIHIDQDEDNHSITVKIELNIEYGVSIPEKSDEIQTKISQEISNLTGLHVSCVHVVFKNIITPNQNHISEENIPENIESPE